MIKNFCKNNKKLCLLILGIVGIIFVIILGIYFIVMLGGNDSVVSKYEKLNNTLTSDGKKYPTVNISDYDKFSYINTDELVDIFDTKGDAVVYFGYPTCLYCRTAIQVLVDNAKNTELDVLYYYDVESKENDNGKILDLIGDEFVEVRDNKKEIYLPLVIFIVDGSVVSYNKGTLFSQENPYQELDQSQIDGLGEIYKYGIMDVLDSKKNKGLLN